MGEPMGTQHGEGTRRQRDIAILVAFAGLNVQLHASAIDLGDTEVRTFVQAQPAAVDGAQADLVGRQLELSEDAPDLVDAQHDGQFVSGMGSEQFKAGPGLA